MLGGCGDNAGSSASTLEPTPTPPPVLAPDAPGRSNEVPESPAAGESRAGQIYSIYIQPEATGDTVAFTVFEPALLEGGETYPLIIHSHGFQGQRFRSVPFSGVDLSNPLASDFTDISQLVASGYGVISIDQRAHGESTGENRVMDPEFEGQNNLAILDWAEIKLDWLAYGPSVDGSDPHNVLVGAVGGSYGSMYQRMLHSIDPRRRLDALVPEIGPNNVVSSLSPNGVVKTIWNVGLFAVGSVTGLPTGSLFDPFVTREFVASTLANQLTAPLQDYLSYHSPSYFCEGQAVATNGEFNGETLVPQYPPIAGPAIHAWFWQGMRDTLFGFNEAFAGYECLRALGGDVRISTYQRGHNTLLPVTDPGVIYQPVDTLLATDCGGTDVTQATLAFFDRYLKGIPDALNNIPRGVCLSLAAGDSVLVDEVSRGTRGSEHHIPATTVIAGVPNIPVVVDLGITADENGEVLAGVPWLEVTIEAISPVNGDPIVFAGLGHVRANNPVSQLLPDLIDNQITPLRGLGTHALDMIGVAERLAPGDSLVLMLYGGHDQYLATGNISPNVPAISVSAVSVGGKVWLPLLGPVPAIE